MDDSEPPKDELESYRVRTSGSGRGRGGKRRKTRVSSGGSDDEALFSEIMRTIRKIERQAGNVPTLSTIANETCIPVNRIRQVISKFLPYVTAEGDTEFASSLRALLLETDACLVENGLISPEEWAQVQIEREKTGEPISLILSRLGMASENQVKNALELQYGVNYLPLSKVEPPSVECLHLVPEALMRQHQLAPVAKDGNRITIAMVNPNDLLAIDHIKMLLKGMQIKLSVCTEADFQSFMQSIYLSAMNSDDNAEASGFIVSSLKEGLANMDEGLSTQELEIRAADAPIALLADQIIAKAIRNNISHIHIEPQEQEIAIRHRLDGVMRCDRILPKPLLPALVSRFKVMSHLDVAEHLLPQEGKFQVTLDQKRIVFVISIVPARFGERVVLQVENEGAS